QAEDGIRDRNVTGVQTCALPILIAAFLGYLPGGIAELGRRSLEWVTTPAALLRRYAEATKPRAGPVLSDRGRAALDRLRAAREADRKSVVEGKRGELGGGRMHET